MAPGKVVRKWLPWLVNNAFQETEEVLILHVLSGQILRALNSALREGTVVFVSMCSNTCSKVY